MEFTKQEREFLDVEEGDTLTLFGPVEVELIGRDGLVSGIASQPTPGAELVLTGVRGTRLAKLVEVPMTEVEVAQEKVRAAQAELEVLEAAAEELRMAEFRTRKQGEFDAMMAKPDDLFYAEDPGYDERPYILPFGRDYAKFNPLDDADRENHAFGPTWTANSTAIICKKDERQRPTRLIWTSGLVGRGDHDLIGQRFTARHDQTGGRLGEYEIVGLAFFGPDGSLARTVGEVPNVKLAQSTYK